MCESGDEFEVQDLTEVFEACRSINELCLISRAIDFHAFSVLKWSMLIESRSLVLNLERQASRYKDTS